MHSSVEDVVEQNISHCGSRAEEWLFLKAFFFFSFLIPLLPPVNGMVLPRFRISFFLLYFICSKNDLIDHTQECPLLIISKAEHNLIKLIRLAIRKEIMKYPSVGL